MPHRAHPDFWAHYNRLPPEIQDLADSCFELLKSNPRHLFCHLKRIRELWAVRVDEHYRALGLDVGGRIYWIWIGTHAEYDKIIA